jgi:hypothetical protein
LYKRLFRYNTYGVDRIYTREEIEKAKASSFEREYNLKYLGLIGMSFILNMYSRKSLGIDSGFGSSPFSFLIKELTKFFNE